MKRDHLLEWDQLDLRVRGARIQDLLTELLLKKRAPVSDLKLKFLEGEIQISARIQKGIQVPVKLTVRKVTVSHKALQVTLENIATFGIIPIPKLLFELVGSRRLPAGVSLDTKTMTLTVLLERFLPEFIDVTLESVRIIPGGLVLKLGEGSAGLPA